MGGELEEVLYASSGLPTIRGGNLGKVTGLGGFGGQRAWPAGKSTRVKQKRNVLPLEKRNSSPQSKKKKYE